MPAQRHPAYPAELSKHPVIGVFGDETSCAIPCTDSNVQIAVTITAMSMVFMLDLLFAKSDKA